MTALVNALAKLEAVRFVQYDGEIPPFTGLHRPRLTVEVMLSAVEPTRVLRIGYPTNEGHVFAAEGTSGSGTGVSAAGRSLGRLDPVRRTFQSAAGECLRARTMNQICPYMPWERFSCFRS